MSKTKLAALVFSLAFGVNIIAFVFSKKSFTIDEVKNVWLYELPSSLSPLDASVAQTFGPHNGVIGTLFMPGAGDTDTTRAGLQTELADTWTWNPLTREFTAKLKSGLTYTDDTPITALDWVESLHWAQAHATTLAVAPEWTAFNQMQVSAPDSSTLILKWGQLPRGFDFVEFAQKVLTQPLAGVLHPQNLKRILAGEHVTKDWVSSGPYKMRKWNPKEITLVSRDSFPVQMPKEFFRTLKYQSAPVKNPSCEFMQANADEPHEKGMEEHTMIKTDDEVHVFWVCRSWKELGSFCSKPDLRLGLSQVLAGGKASSLLGKTLSYRIPEGSDVFRTDFRKKIASSLEGSGGHVKEISYFFKSSKDADLELGFVVVPRGDRSSELASQWMQLSSRVGVGKGVERNIVGELAHFPLMVLMKHIKGDPFKKVFLEPDLDEKKLPI